MRPPKAFHTSNGGRFATASLAIKIRQAQRPENIYNDICKNTYSVTRKSGIVFGYDNSNTVTDWQGDDPKLGRSKTWSNSMLLD